MTLGWWCTLLIEEESQCTVVLERLVSRQDCTETRRRTRDSLSNSEAAASYEHVIATNAVDRRRCSWFEQRRFRSYGRSLDRRRFPLAFPLAQEASSSPQKQKRAPSTGETAQKASATSRTESRLYSQSD